MASGQIRIVGGRFRGRKLAVPQVTGLRPTPDRVRERLFNWLMYDIANARCLDLYAGSGALGFEALSRGAKQVTVVELHPRAIAQLSQVVESWQVASQVHIKGMDAKAYLMGVTQSFNVIFLDPPFDDQVLVDILTLLETSKACDAQTMVYIELPKSEQDTIISKLKAWQVYKSATAGAVCSMLLQKG